MAAETIPCTYPGCKATPSKRGYRGHMLFAHGINILKPENSATVENLTEKKPQEVKPMAEGCVDCKLKDRDIKALNEKIDRAEADKAAAVKAAGDAEQRARNLAAEVAKAKQPSLEDLTKLFRDHLAECPDCRRAAIEAMPAEERQSVIKEYAQALGIAPKKIIIKQRGQ